MKSLFDKTSFVDLDKIKHPKTILKLFIEVLRHRYDKIVVGSGGSTSSCRIVAVIQKLIPQKNKIIILGLGGNMHHYISAKQFNINVMKQCKALLVEGKEMTIVLNECGLNNVYYVPNFKAIPYLPVKSVRNYDKIKFLFFARITPFKGVDLICLKCRRCR